jgi:hypothetical protein
MNHKSINKSATHTIRLRGPCRLILVENDTQLAEQKVQIPCEIKADLFAQDFVEKADSIVLRRTFARPTGLTDAQSVRMELRNFSEVRRVLLNPKSDFEIDLEVFKGDYWSGEVASQLQQRNTLEIEFLALPTVAGDIKLIIQE